jgi:hypothetical protein
MELGYWQMLFDYNMRVTGKRLQNVENRGKDWQDTQDWDVRREAVYILSSLA